MTGLYLSRVRLRALRGEALSAVAPLLIPRSKAQAPLYAHRVLWLLFQTEPDARRDFLWRDEGNGRYLVLSPQPPADPAGLFEIDTKKFAPELEQGDRLRFSMRVNPTRAVPSERDTNGRCKARGKRVDVVMHALRDVALTTWDEATGRALSGRALERDGIMGAASVAWLLKLGRQRGFDLVRDPPPEVANYVQVPLDRRPFAERKAAGLTGRPAGFSMLDMSGILEVTDPAVFLRSLPQGFGSAKAFGCGLMLIRRPT